MLSGPKTLQKAWRQLEAIPDVFWIWLGYLKPAALPLPQVGPQSHYSTTLPGQHRRFICTEMKSH